MTQQTFYADPDKQARLEEAIRRGYIIRRLENGLYTYILTDAGLKRWMQESFHSTKEKFK